MAYTHDKEQVTLLGTGSPANTITTSGGGAKWINTSTIPYLVRTVGIQQLATAGLSTAPVASLRDTSPSATGYGATGDQFSSVTFTTGITSSSVKYVENLDQEISPGDMLAVTWSTTGAAGRACITAVIEARHEDPANDTTLVTG